MKTLFRSLLSAAVLLMSASLFAQSGKTSTVDPAAFEAGLKKNPGAQLLDVRSDSEYQGGHLKSALNIDINSPQFDAQVAKLDKKKPVYVYCAVGGRSSKAMGKLQKMGFVEVVNLDGGIKAWTREQKPVVR